MDLDFIATSLHICATYHFCSLQFHVTQTVCKQNYLFTFFSLQSGTGTGDPDGQLGFSFQMTIVLGQNTVLPISLM